MVSQPDAPSLTAEEITDFRQLMRSMRSNGWAGDPIMRGLLPQFPTVVTLPTIVGNEWGYRCVTLEDTPDLTYQCLRTAAGAWAWVLLSGSHVEYHVENYGALGDGTTDDTTAIQAALDAANAAGGGIVHFGEGTFMANKLTLYTAVTIKGSGPHATIVKLRSAQNTALLTSSGFVTTDTSAGIHSFSIEDIAFDGDKANQSSNADSGCVQVYGYNYVLRNVRIRNGESVGLYTNWGTDEAAPGPNGISMETRISDLEVSSCGTDGIYWNGPHDSMWVNAIVFENAEKGINIGARGNALMAVNCHSWGNAQDYAWYLNTTGVNLVNCQGAGASVVQVSIRGNDTAIIGGAFYAGGGATTGISLDAAVAGIHINTKLLNFTTAAIALGTNDAGGNTFMGTAYATAGAVITGTPAASSVVMFATVGGTTAPAVQNGHTLDTSDAHDASAISIVDTGGFFTGTEVEAALQEIGAPGWKLLARGSAGSTVASITFSSLTNKVYRLTLFVNKVTAAGQLLLRLNNDATGTYDDSQAGPGATAFTIGNVSLDVASGEHAIVAAYIAKPVSSEEAMVVGTWGIMSTATATSSGSLAGQWNNTAALITRIDLLQSAGDFGSQTYYILEGSG